MTGNVVLISNTAWSIYNFRRQLMQELQSAGYRVIAVAPADDYAARISECGASYIAQPMDNRGTNPVRDLRLCLDLRRIIAEHRPCCVLTFTIKPNLYGALAGWSLGVPVIGNISGLGTVFIKRNWVTKVVSRLYKVGLRAASYVFFQNGDDREHFISLRLVDPEKAGLLPGSGVDTRRFSPVRTARTRAFRFLLLGRILWDKGVGEFVEAATAIKAKYPDCEFVIMGFLGVSNATAISRSQIEEWERSGVVTYSPATDDVRPEIARADCVVLPSYREGAPKALLEAASMAKPIITTDVPGCRQVVDDAQTGFLVKPRDARDLAAKMEQMVRLDDREREAMGMRGREKMIREFDEHIVIDRYMQALERLAAVETSIAGAGDVRQRAPDRSRS